MMWCGRSLSTNMAIPVHTIPAHSPRWLSTSDFEHIRLPRRVLVLQTQTAPPTSSSRSRILCSFFLLALQRMASLYVASPARLHTLEKLAYMVRRPTDI